jgi:DNA-binding CsgD family transcriptional regulator
VALARFEAELDEHQAPEAFDGVARARWWTGDVNGAIEAWEQAHAAYREAGNPAAAARTALFLSQEYAQAVGNEAAASGWLARAERLAREAAPSPARGWLLLARAARASDPRAALAHSLEALETARPFRDPDLELASLGRAALARIQLGDVEEGMALFDEAMVAAAGGQARDLRTLGDLYCCAVLAAEATLDVSRFEQWTALVMGFLERHRHPDLFTFCGTCCAEVVGAAGDWQEVERWLLDTLRTLEQSGRRPRCVHPAARLASLRVQQGRLEEAEHLLEGYEDLPEAAQPMVALHLARGRLALAAARLHRRLNEIGRHTLIAVPLLVQLAEVQLARADLDGATLTAEWLAAIGERSGLARVVAEADLAAGAVMAARDDPAAPGRLRRALDAFIRLRMPHAAARTRVALARSLAAADPDSAVAEARDALASFERMGSTRDADAVARFLRGLGVRGRTGPRAHTELSKREIEVLRLLGDGLTNAEIAARLYISTKTVATHVGNILSKLGLRNRAEAAVYAQRNLSQIQPAGR